MTIVLSARPVSSSVCIEPADVLVEVGDHAEESRRRPALAYGSLYFAGHPVRAVRRVGRQVEEERLVLAAFRCLIQSSARLNQTSVQ